MDHITVCIPTYKRPQSLGRLLGELQDQATDGLFTYSIVVADNDFAGSALAVAKDWQSKSRVPIVYCHQPEQNISLARNTAIEHATGDLVAFVDDDEFPSNRWLLELYNTYKDLGVDGVLGPVKPYFEGDPPRWLVDGKFCERETHPTGTTLRADQTRTGNALLSRSLFGAVKFNPQLGRRGGEDIEFFTRSIEGGRRFAWCNEAEVFEVVFPERWKKGFYIRKYLQIGGLTGEMAKRWSRWNRCKWLAKAFASLGFYSLAIPFASLAGQHLFMKCILKGIYYLGWLAGFLWRAPVKFRY
jgi:glycosyltransferase involved in cell wall biosynthesis